MMTDRLLEIERKLNIKITMPQICYFCGEEIVKKYGAESDSLCFHSLDGDHDNWVPSNKVPAHCGCHITFHHKGVPRSPEAMAQTVQTRRERYGSSWFKDPEAFGRAVSEGFIKRSAEEKAESAKKRWATRQARYGPTGVKDPEAFSDTMREAAKRGWATRRERYGPTGVKPK